MAVPGYALIVLGAMVHVTPGGAPEVTLRLTVPLNPPKAFKLRVNDAVLPAPML